VPAVTTSVFNRRRAERFAQLLDEAQGGRRHHVRSSSDDQLAELIAVSDHLVALNPPVEVDPDFRAGLRAMLIATAERDGIGATATEPEPPPRATRVPGRRIRARGAVIIGVAVGAIAVSGMSAASENAMPGDALYGVKRSTERAQLALASSDVTRGQLFLDFARTRLAEARAVRGDGAGFAGVLADMDSDTREGVKLLNASALQRRDDTPLDAVDSFVTGQRQQITGMLDRLSGAERTRAVDSLALLDQVSQRSKALRGTLDCSGAATGTDVLGPKPAVCSSAPGRDDPAGRGSEPAERERQPAPSHTENSGPGPSTGGTGTTPAPGTSPSPGVSTPTPSPTPSGDGGLLDGLGRILGDLLG
jgi:hypothetical protein